MSSRRLVLYCLWVGGLTIAFLLVTADAAVAHNCQNFTDCFASADAATDSLLGMTFLGMLSMGLDFVPYVGTAKGVVEAVTGRDLLTGEELSDAERLLGLVPGGLGHAGDLMSSGLRHGDDLAALATSGTRHTDDLAAATRHTDDLPTGEVGTIRNVNPRSPGEPGLHSGVPNRFENCARCSVATDRTLAGNPTVADPSLPTSPRWIEQQMGRSFGPQTTADAIRTDIAAAGPGSRGIIIAYGQDQVGHAFNVVNQRGTIRFLDGQTGAAADLTPYTRYYLMRTN